MFIYLAIPVLFFTFIFLFIKLFQNKKLNDNNNSTQESQKQVDIREKQQNQQIQQQQQQQKKQQDIQQQEQQYQQINQDSSFINNYKGFKDIVDYNIKNNLIAISSKDNNFKVFSLKEIKSKNEYQYILYRIENQYASCISLDETGKEIAIGLSFDKTVEILEMKNKKYEKKRCLTNIKHDSEIMKICMEKEKIITVEQKNMIRIISMDGLLMQKIITNQISHNQVMFNRECMYLCSYLPNVQIYQFKKDKQSQTMQYKKTNDLKGLMQSVKSADSTSDNLIAITIQQDGLFNIYQRDNTDIEHKLIYSQYYQAIISTSIFSTTHPNLIIYALLFTHAIQIRILSDHTLVKTIEHNEEIKQINFLQYGQELYLLCREKSKISVNFIQKIQE